MENHNNTRCFNPRVIKNRYTGEYMRISCGICKACLLARRDKMSVLCEEEEKHHRYTLFVTLTFDKDHLPLLQPVRKEHNNRTGYRFFNLCHRYKHLGSCVHFEPDSYHKSPNWVSTLSKKMNVNGFFPYVSIREGQTFLKRLRKYLTRYSDEKIKYYCVSEYGPEHFRPHLHLLLFYDTEKTNKFIGRCIIKAWAYHQKVTKKTKKGATKTIYKLRRFGRIDYSLSNGSVHSYVSSYVNCNVSLPFFYSSAKFAKPFCLHSQNFGNPISKVTKKEIYEDEQYSFTQRSIQRDEKLVTLELQGTFKSRYFPRCREFSRKSFPQLYQTYTIYQQAQREYKTDNINTIANCIWFELHMSLSNKVTDYFKHLLKCQDFRRLFPISSVNPSVFIDRIKSELYLSKHFINFVCDNDVRLFHQRIKQIVKFWEHDNYSKLVKFYTNQQEFSYMNPNDLDYIVFNYDNFEVYFSTHIFDYDGDLYSFELYENFEDYFKYKFKEIFNVDGSVNIHFTPMIKEHRFYNTLYDDSIVKFNKSIKHKKQNDLNNVFKDL